MRLEWSAFALADRDGIFDYIEAENPRAAITIDERIESETRVLLEFPRIGRPGRIAGTRELVISGTPYIAAYSIMDDTIRILRILHGARQWPDELPD